MAAKTTQSKPRRLGKTFQASLLELVYLLSYQMKAGRLVYCLNRMVMSIFVILCFALSSSVMIVCLDGKVKFLSMNLLPNSKIDMMLSKQMVSSVEFGVLFAMLIFTAYCAWLFWQVWGASSNDLVFIRIKFENSYANRISFFMISWAAPLIILIISIDRLCKLNKEGEVFSGPTGSLVQTAYAILFVIYFFAGLLLASIGFSDRQSASQVTSQPLSAFLWLDQINLLFSATSALITTFEIDITEIMFFGYSIIALSRWKAMAVMPFKDISIAQISFTIIFCENCGIFIIILMHVFREATINFIRLDYMLIVFLTAFAGRVGYFLGRKIMLGWLFRESSRKSLSRAKALIWILGDVRSKLKLVKEHDLLDMILNRNTILFHVISFFRFHRTYCLMTSCPCHSKLESGGESLVCLSERRKSLKMTLKHLIVLSLTNDSSDHDSVLSLESHYVYAHWLIHFERNFVHGLIIISELKARDPPFYLRIAIDMLVKELKFIEKSRRQNFENLAHHSITLYSIMKAQKEFDTTYHHAQKLLNSFEGLCFHLHSHNVNLAHVEKFIIEFDKWEKLYKSYSNEVLFNPKVRWFDEIFRREFLDLVNKASGGVSPSQDVVLKIIEDADYTENNFFLLVGASRNDFNKIIDCSKNIEQLLEKNYLATRTTSIESIIVDPIAGEHGKFMKSYIKNARPNIMDKLQSIFVKKSNGYLVAVNVTIKNFFDYKNKTFRFFAHFKRDMKHTNIIFCDKSGHIYGMTKFLAKIMQWLPLLDVGKFQIQRYLTVFNEFFKEGEEDSSAESDAKKVAAFNQKLINKKITYFCTYANQNSRWPGAPENNDDDENIVDEIPKNLPMQVIYQTLSRYCKFQPRRFKMKASIRSFQSGATNYYAIYFSKIKPVQLSDLQVKSKLMTLIYRITLMKLFIRSWKLSHEQSREARRVNMPLKPRRASTFIEMVRKFPQGGRRPAFSSAMLPSGNIPITNRDFNHHQAIIKVDTYLPVKFRALKYIIISSLLLATSLNVYIFAYITSQIEEAAAYLNDTISAETMYNPILELMTAKQVKLVPNDESMKTLVSSIEDSWALHSTHSFDVFKKNPKFVAYSQIQDSDFTYPDFPESYEVEVSHNVFDTLTHTIYYLNRKNVSERLVAKTSVLFETIRDRLVEARPFDPSKIIIDQMTTTLNYLVISTAVIICLILLMFVFIMISLYRYRNSLLDYGSKVQFSPELIERSSKMRIKLELGVKKFDLSEVSMQRTSYSSHVTYQRINFPFLKVSLMLIIILVYLYWFSALAIWPANLYASRITEILSTKKLVTQNSFDMGIALHKTLYPVSTMSLDLEVFRARMNLQNKNFFIDSHTSWLTGKIEASIQKNLCSSPPLIEFSFCQSVEGGLFRNDYLQASTYIMQRIPVWLKSQKSDSNSAIFTTLIMIRIVTLWMADEIGLLSQKALEESIAILLCAFLVSIASVVIVLWVLLLKIQNDGGDKLAACFRLIRFLSPDVILANSQIKKFVYRANQSQ